MYLVSYRLLLHLFILVCDGVTCDGVCVCVGSGVSALMGPVLRQVPLAVLFGVFLYMGIASMSGVQLVHRLQLVFMPVKHHPEDVGYVRRVSVAY